MVKALIVYFHGDELIRAEGRGDHHIELGCDTAG